MSPARKNIPTHLKRYVVEQNYARYTPEDQAAWRFIMRQLRDFLSLHAHESYVGGLKKSGISVERIPNIDEMDSKLAEFGWGAVPVSGFIPPAAFMEFQSLGILPIASDMRTIDHLAYTPAPDIVHEAAGHAPILANPEFAAYLKQYGEIARHAIITREDMNQYEAIRRLSDAKENPDSTRAQIKAAEEKLIEVNRQLTTVSEAGWLSRMNWWTAEYGLIGRPEKPQIFGAGLLSSVGESRQCLNAQVKKIPLTIDCIDVSYDITEPQPQLFVTPHFAWMGEVLEQLADRMAFRLGGHEGLRRALAAKTVNTVELDSGLQISGQLETFTGSGDRIDFLRFSGPVTLSVARSQLEGHGTEYHKEGFSSPLGRPKGEVKEGSECELIYPSGIKVTGRVRNLLRENGELILIQLTNAKATLGEQILFDPSWGPYDLAVGEKVIKVFGGPADRENFGETEDFVASRVPARRFTSQQLALFDLLNRIRRLRENPSSSSQEIWRELAEKYLRDFPDYWLVGVELIELVHLLDLESQLAENLARHLQSKSHLLPAAKACVEDGLRLATIRL